MNETPVRPPSAAATDLACPRCPEGRLDPARAAGGVVGCPRCGHRAAQVHVAEQVWLEQQDAQLHTRLDWVRQQVAAGTVDAAGSPAAVGAPGSAAGPFGGPPVVPGAAPDAGHRPLGVQGLLLGIGALCLVLAAIVFVAVAWERLGAGGQVGALLVVVAALSGAAHALRDRYRGTAETLAAVAASVAAVALVAAPELGLGTGWMRDRTAAWAAVALTLVALLCGVLAVVSRLVAWRVGLVMALVSAGFSAAIALDPGQDVGPLGGIALALAAGAVLLLHPARDKGFGTEAAWVGAGLGGLAVLFGLAAYGDTGRPGGWALAWSAVAAGAAAPLLRPLLPSSALGPAPEPVRRLAPLVAGLGAGHAAVLALARSAQQVTVPVVLYGVVAAGFVAVAARPAWRPAGLVAATAGWLVALPFLPDPVPWPGSPAVPPVALHLAVAAVALLGLSFAPRAAPAVWPAAGLGGLALWVVLVDREVDLLEAYTAPAAGLLLVAGLLYLRVHRDAGSLVVLGPALALVALPSAVLALGQAADGEAPARAAAVILGGAAAAVLGAWLRLRAPLLVGLAAVLVAGSGQLLALADTLPRWVSLAAAGTLLVAAGFTAERLGRTGRHLWEQARRLR